MFQNRLLLNGIRGLLVDGEILLNSLEERWVL